MSEPSGTATSLQALLPGLYHYSVEDDRIGTRSEAYVLADRGGLVLIDPLPVEATALAALGRIEAIVIAAPGHQRSAWRWRRASGAPVYAPRDARDLVEAPDATFGEGDRLPGGLRPVHAPGPRDTHHALLLDAGPGVLFVTDLAASDSLGVAVFIPDEHMSDPRRSRASARRLLALRFDVLCFGHGAPILHGGHRALEDLVARDERRDPGAGSGRPGAQDPEGTWPASSRGSSRAGNRSPT